MAAERGNSNCWLVIDRVELEMDEPLWEYKHITLVEDLGKKRVVGHYNKSLKIQRPKTDEFIYKTDEFTLNSSGADEFWPTNLARRIY